MRFVKVATGVAPEARYGTVALLVLAEECLREVGVLEYRAILPLRMGIRQRPSRIVQRVAA